MELLIKRKKGEHSNKVEPNFLVFRAYIEYQKSCGFLWSMSKCFNEEEELYNK